MCVLPMRRNVAPRGRAVPVGESAVEDGHVEGLDRAAGRGAPSRADPRRVALPAQAARREPADVVVLDQRTERRRLSGLLVGQLSPFFLQPGQAAPSVTHVAGSAARPRCLVVGHRYADRFSPSGVRHGGKAAGGDMATQVRGWAVPFPYPIGQRSETPRPRLQGRWVRRSGPPEPLHARRSTWYARAPRRNLIVSTNRGMSSVLDDRTERRALPPVAGSGPGPGPGATVLHLPGLPPVGHLVQRPRSVRAIINTAWRRTVAPA